MKCPEMFKIIQHNIRENLVNKDNIIVGEYHLLIEKQDFQECYKEECAAWDKKNKKCGKVGK